MYESERSSLIFAQAATIRFPTYCSGRHRLDVSTCQEYRRRWESAASPSTGRQCGTVYHQHCVTASLNTFKRRLKTYLSWMPPGAVVAFRVILAPDINVMTYLLTYFETTKRQRRLVSKIEPKFRTFLTPAKFRGGVGRLSGWINQVQPRTEPLTYFCRVAAVRVWRPQLI